MVTSKLVSMVCVSMALFACSPAQMPSRGLSDVTPAIAGPGLNGGAVVAVAQSDFDIVGHVIQVPQTLLVSEADVFLPDADIVWHGDPVGDRRAQVKAMFEAAFVRGTADMDEGRPVIVSVVVHKFHALTPKTRATFGGNFAMQFYLTIQDATTGEVLDGPRLVIADKLASGGRAALREEAQGITQKVVIEAKLTETFQQELSKPILVEPGAPAVSRNDFSPSDLTLAN